LKFGTKYAYIESAGGVKNRVEQNYVYVIPYIISKKEVMPIKNNKKGDLHRGCREGQFYRFSKFERRHS
jgi:hypothetical protein